MAWTATARVALRPVPDLPRGVEEAWSRLLALLEEFPELTTVCRGDTFTVSCGPVLMDGELTPQGLVLRVWAEQCLSSPCLVRTQWARISATGRQLCHTLSFHDAAQLDLALRWDLREVCEAALRG